MSYYPKRPVKSFQDLEVYQKVLGAAIVISKRLLKEVDKKRKGENKLLKEKVMGITEKTIDYLLNLPVLIATAHSVRFGNSKLAISKLEEAMLFCNLAVVYLEQFRDLGNKEIEREFFEEQIKNLLLIRMKIMRLQKSWKKFIRLDGEDKKEKRALKL